jgi:cytochrome P450
MSADPPQAPGGLPVVGQTVSFLRDPLGSLHRWGHTDESVVRLHVAGRRVCLVTAPGAVERVLATDRASYRKAEIVRDRLGSLQGGSLPLLEGDQWRERRETLQPAFTRDRVAAIAPLTVDHATEMVQRWPADAPVRIVEQARTLVLGILADALFGLDFRGDRSPIHQAADDVLARMDMQSVSTYLPEWVPTPTNLRFRRAVSTLHDRLDAIVEKRRDAEKPDGSLLSIMLAAGLSPETVRDELIALLFAGYDSTATALSCTIALLGDHPDVQSRLHDELDAVVGDRSPEPDDLAELSLLDAVVRESLRLYPPQYVLFREPEARVQLQGYGIEPGTILVLPPWVLQRDPQYWAEPSAFRPDRWLDGSGTDGNRPAYAYFPYGGGPRHCLGAGLANQTLRLVLAVLCQHRRLGSTESFSVSAGPTLSVAEELRVTATARDR